eukprot:scaffold232302_cov32-Tisochrysis_lutea.AAC.5
MLTTSFTACPAANRFNSKRARRRSQLLSATSSRLSQPQLATCVSTRTPVPHVPSCAILALSSPSQPPEVC